MRLPHLAAAEPARHVVLVLEEERAVGRHPFLRPGVDVGGTRQTGPEGQRRHQVRELVGQVLADHVLVRLTLAAAVGAEFQRGLTLEDRARELLAREGDLDWNEVARLGLQAQVAARSERDRNVGTIDREHAWKLFRVVRRALRVDQVELGREGELERRSVLKQLSILRVDAARKQDVVGRPRLGRNRRFPDRCRRTGALGQEQRRRRQRRERKPNQTAHQGLVSSTRSTTANATTWKQSLAGNAV